MKKIKFGLGGLLMLSAMMISDSAAVLTIYLGAALLHELGHLAAARLLGIGIKEIRFDFSGVRICTEEGLTSYRQELLLSLAGPTVSLASAFAVMATNALWGGDLQSLLSGAGVFLSSPQDGAGSPWGFFALSSLIQAISNLLPVESFDGGRALYCALASVADERVARAVLRVASALSAFLLWTVALYLMLRISAGLGIYVFASCIFALSVLRQDGSATVIGRE
ncbi:MAG: hypothetical protein IJY39_05855 [Clostridia bacterium]|nr:hypothetical protein [Clostridia bacterium]